MKAALFDSREAGAGSTPRSLKAACNMSSRRVFLASVAAAATAGTMGFSPAHGESDRPLPSPDAELIAVCAEFDRCERQTSIIHGTGPGCVADDDEASAASAPFFQRMDALLDQMDDLRATTAAGIQARAHSLALHGGRFEYDFGCRLSIVGRLLTFLLRDSLALGGADPVKPLASPDAKLLEACAAFEALERAYRATAFGDGTGSAADIAVETDRERIESARAPLVARMVELQATTREGLAARARSLALWDGELMKAGAGDIGECLTFAIVRDLVRM